LLIGDETALPAIERRLEELPADTRALVVVEVESGNEQALSSRAEFQVVWVPRIASQEVPGDQLIQALRALQFSNQRCFAWAATETQAARAIRGYLTQERGFDKKWVKAAGYWQRGAAGTHVVVED
jgi:NADPH-dependent ferric siderophore reductase